jgi:PAS domain S-box-containing protein
MISDEPACLDRLPQTAGLAQQAMEMLIARENRMQLALKAGRVHYWDWDIVADAIVWSDGLEKEIGGPAPGDMAAFRRLVHPDDVGFVAARVQAALEDRGQYEAEFRMIRSDGGVRWCLARAIVVRDGLGAPVRLVGIDQDITERRAMMQQAIESEARLRMVYGSLAAAEAACKTGTWDWDIAGDRVFVSDAYRALYGLSAEAEVTYQSWLDRIVSEDRDSVIRYGEAYMESGLRYDLEFRIVHPAAGIRWIAALGALTRDDEGRPVRFTGINIDVTERKRAEQARSTTPGEKERAPAPSHDALLALAGQLRAERERLAEARKRIAHAERLKLIGQFVGNIVHDINNVLTTLAGGVRFLRRRALADAERDVLVEVERAIDRGAGLVRRVLDFSREGGRSAELVKPLEMIGDDLSLLRHLVGPEISLELVAKGPIWPILAPPSALQTVLFNLVANSRDALRPGGAIRIRLANCYATERPPQLPSGDYVAITVADDGAGMAPEVLARIGEPFFTTKNPGAGTGLGMSAAFDFARECGGALLIDSEVDIGTTVRLYLPRAAVAGEPVATPEAAIDSRRHGGATILVAESEANLREHLVAQFQTLGYRVLEAGSDEIAKSLVAEGAAVDLVVAALAIEARSGVELVGILREMRPGLPAIFIMGPSSTKPPRGEIAFRRPFSEALLARAVLERLGRLSGGIDMAEGLRLSERVRDRIRSPRIRSVYDRWKGLVEDLGVPPPARHEEQLRAELGEDCFLVRIEGRAEAPSFRYVSVGTALTERLGRELAGVAVGASDEDAIGSLSMAYRRCIRGVAFFDFARYAVGEGRTLVFERLLLPLSDDGETITHLFGVATFEELDDTLHGKVGS